MVFPNLSYIADGKSQQAISLGRSSQVQRQEMEDAVRRFESKLDCNIGVLTVTALGVLAFDVTVMRRKNILTKYWRNWPGKDISTTIKNTMVTKPGSGHGKHIIFRFHPPEFQSSSEKINVQDISEV